MYTKEQLWTAFAKEFRIIKHLAEKIPAGQEHHKPTEKQRTTLELLQYLSMIGKGIFNLVKTGDGSKFAVYAEESKSVTIENFSQAMNAEESEMKEIFDSLSESDMKETISAWGMTDAKSMFILMALQILTAYKMQLFLYIKSSGNHAIGTSNLWAGMDMPTPKE